MFYVHICLCMLIVIVMFVLLPAWRINFFIARFPCDSTAFLFWKRVASFVQWKLSVNVLIAYAGLTHFWCDHRLKEFECYRKLLSEKQSEKVNVVERKAYVCWSSAQTFLQHATCCHGRLKPWKVLSKRPRDRTIIIHMFVLFSPRAAIS